LPYSIIDKANPDLSLKNNAGDTPLVCQLKAGKIFNAVLILKKLGDIGEDEVKRIIQVKDVEGNSLVHKLAEIDEVDVLKSILPKSGMDTSSTNSQVRLCVKKLCFSYTIYLVASFCFHIDRA
jgi:hypothetical protein